MTRHQKNLLAIRNKYADQMTPEEKQTINSAVLKCKELNGIFAELLEGDSEATADKVRDSLELCEEIDACENMAGVDHVDLTI